MPYIPMQRVDLLLIRNDKIKFNDDSSRTITDSWGGERSEGLRIIIFGFFIQEKSDLNI